MIKKKPLVILTGPTAVGKTALSIQLAKKLNGEIISADSMQVYRGMDIGSAKILPEETQGVPHHLIDVLSPHEAFDVYRFQQMAKEKMHEIYQRKHLPIVVGGTGFYIQALLYDITFTQEPTDPDYRKKLEDIAKTGEGGKLFAQLKRVDPQSAVDIHPHNIKRIIRALEYHHLTGDLLSEHNRQMKNKPSPYAFCYFVLNAERETLYQTIDQRVDKMIQHGLVNEVQSLKDDNLTPDMVSMQGLGYKEIYAYLDGKMTLDEAIHTVKRDTRHFAKRQLTWFRREKDVIWIQKEDFADDHAILEHLIRTISRQIDGIG